jgi:quercetin dioxygenase-like cupin family protein
VIVAEGEMVLVMEDGSEAAVWAGNVVAENATRHGWQNRTDRPATMRVVFLGPDEGGGPHEAGAGARAATGFGARPRSATGSNWSRRGLGP